MTRRLDNEQLLAALRWRYATKQFDRARKIPDDDWQLLEQALILTPSSYGLEPWQFIVVTSQAIKDALVPHAWGQRQVADCSHLLVIAVPLLLTAADVDRYLERIVAVRGVERQALAGLRRMIMADVVDGPRSQPGAQWAKLQSYIALGNFMTSAALLGIDTCPMEGFQPDQFDELLELAPRGLTTSVLCPAGYRDSSDQYAGMNKVRRDPTDVVLHF